MKIYLKMKAEKFKNLLKMKYFVLIVCVLLLTSCKNNRLNVNVSSVLVQSNLFQFEKILFENKANEVDSILNGLYPEHGLFIDIYTHNVLRIGGLDHELFAQNLQGFLSDTVYRQVADTVLNVFSDITQIEEELNEGFKHFHYYFPEKMIPDVYTYISGFNESIIVGDGIIGVSLDKYLGVHCPFYQYLGWPQFKISQMYPHKIVPDVFYSIALSEFTFNDSIDNLLSNMIYQGKLIYFTEAMNPQLPDTVLMGYSAKKLKWCEQNENLMWSYLVNKKLIYTIERLDIKKFIGDAPFTNVFTENSPGRTGIWIGWQIVRSFMNNNSEVTLDQLMKLDDPQYILNQSKYYPD